MTKKELLLGIETALCDIYGDWLGTDESREAISNDAKQIADAIERSRCKYFYQDFLTLQNTDEVIDGLPEDERKRVQRAAEELGYGVVIDSHEKRLLAIDMFIRGYVFQYMEKEDD